MRNRLLIFTFIFCALAASAQEERDFVHQTFKDTRVINGHSVETEPKGQMKFIISHRFGSVSGGVYEMFGLDEATIRIGLDYGITNRLTVGAGRSGLEKTYDGFLKYKLLRQSKGENSFPLTVTAMSSLAIRTLDFENPDRTNYFSSRMFYANQLLIAHKFGGYFSLQVMPTHVHRNLVENTSVDNDVFSIGSAMRIQITKMLAIQTEYYYTPTGQLSEDVFNNSVSLGIDIETKGHNFQLSFTNSRGMIEKFFIGETRGNILDGDIYFGFNITRDFRIGERR
ncbi:DUF5777 family beta-barrel protein [Halocola ammonii]